MNESLNLGYLYFTVILRLSILAVFEKWLLFHEASVTSQPLCFTTCLPAPVTHCGNSQVFFPPESKRLCWDADSVFFLIAFYH